MFDDEMLAEWTQLPAHVLDFEQRGVVTRTFRRLDPEAQRKLVGAILMEAGEGGPAKLNVRGVARRAGVSVGALYSYFGSRDRLATFGVELSARYLVDLFALSEPYLTQSPLREALRMYLGTGLDWMQGQLAMMAFFGRAAYQGDPRFAATIVRPVADAMLRVVRAMLAAAAARGELRPDVDLEATARVVNTLLVAAGDSQLLPHLNDYFHTTGDEVARERMIEALVELVVRGIAAAEGGAP
jgi:AcrR family transcriptional regulator